MNPENEAKRLEIMRSVRQKCTDLAAKLEQLHVQVIKPVEQAREVVADTVDKVTEGVSTAHHVVDSVGKQVSKWPWLSVAGSLAAGLGTGYLMGRASPEESPTTAYMNGFISSPPAPKKPGFIAEQLNKLTGLAVGAGLAAVRDLVKDQLPHWGDAADHFTNDLTRQLGAVPFSGPVFSTADSVTESAV